MRSSAGLEVVGLDGDDEQRDGAVEARDRLRVRDRPLAVTDEGQPVAPDRLDRPFRSDAEGSRERGDDAPDPAWAEHGDRCRRHASAGSITTFTYWVSE